MKIKNWEKYQHYQSGRGAPPWIKLYRGLLDDKEWFSLDPGSAKFLISLWLLCAETNGIVPDSETLAFRLRLDSKVIAKYLKDCSHWIISDDSEMLASCYQVATPETETETETDQKLSDYSDDVIKVLDHLNNVTGSKYRPVPANVNLIKARIQETSLDECLSVIDKQVELWSNDKVMRPYLRPATLFNHTKFHQYAGASNAQSFSILG